MTSQPPQIVIFTEKQKEEYKALKTKLSLLSKNQDDFKVILDYFDTYLVSPKEKKFTNQQVLNLLSLLDSTVDPNSKIEWSNFFKNLAFYPRFEDLKVSTKTIQVYTNLCIDLPTLFSRTPITKIPESKIPLTKKKRKPDIRRVFAKPGEIISIRRMYKGKYDFRGIVTHPEKIEISALRFKRDNGQLRAFEQKHLQKLEENDGKNVLDFQNQVCIIMNVGTRQVLQTKKKIKTSCIVPINLNIMMFKNNFKIVGCKHEEEAHQVVRLLWEKIQNLGCYTLVDENPPRFIIDSVMTNLDFSLGFNIDRKILNEVMNRPEYSSVICSSIFEPTSHTNVKIRMCRNEPERWYNDCLVFSEEDKSLDNDGLIVVQKRINITNNPYKNPKNAKKTSKYHTFLVPRSGKIIISGKYMPLIEEQYYLFLDIVHKYKNIVEEKTY
jgi:hypothetical protein